MAQQRLRAKAGQRRNRSLTTARSLGALRRTSGLLLSDGKSERLANDGRFIELLTVLAPQHPIKRIGRLVDERLGIVLERMEVLERQIAAITDLVERLDDGRPVRGAVEQRAESVQVELVRSLVPFLSGYS